MGSLNLSTKKDYYSDSGGKVKDFFIGLGILYGIYLAFNIVSQSILELIYFVIPYSSSFFGINQFFIYAIIPLVIAILIERKYFKERRYVRIGMISAVVIPIIIFGACLSIFLATWG